MTVRMKDIAQHLGLSVITISKVLRDHPDISEGTKARVLQYVKKLDYQPNVLARSLVTGHSYLVGLIVPDLIHPFFAEIAKTLSDTIRPAGYSLIIASSEEDAELETQEIRQLVARQLDCLVIASTASSPEQFNRLDENGTKYVLIDRGFPGLTANFSGSDDAVAGQIATRHLIDMGCKRIAHIRGRDNSTGVARCEGYRQALKEARMPYREQMVIRRTSVDVASKQQGAEAMKLLLKQTPRPDGVFCYNDPLAIGAMNAILDAGLRVPEDVAIIGCGNLHYDDSLRVPLSSVDQHSKRIGQSAGEMVLACISAKAKLKPASVIVTPTLVIRLSSQKNGATKIVASHQGELPPPTHTSQKKSSDEALQQV